MWFAARLVPSCQLALPGRYFVFITVTVFGAVLCSLGFVRFKRTKTTVDPRTPEAASALVVSGVYRVTRNPMYLGLLVNLFAWAYFVSNGLSFLFLPAFVLYMNRFQIRLEERALQSKFGQAYADYRSQVRRWL